LLTSSVSISGTAYYFGVGPFARGRTKLVVSTTTSLYDTGLLDTIEDQFEAEYPIDIYFISAGSSIAMRYAERGDADMILVHAPSEELAFLEGGYGVCRKIIAYNFFAIVGPGNDPAKAEGLSPTQALMRIVEAGRKGETFWVSRGDDSGTHIKEKDIWAIIGFKWNEIRQEGWFMESGTGMGKTLLIAEEKSAYTLADLGTYLKYSRDNLITLAIVSGERKELLNVYSAIAVNRTYNPEVNFEAAITFIKFLVSEKGQRIISQFGRDIYQQSLFYSAAQPLKQNADSQVAGWIREIAYFEGKECPERFQDDHKELYD